MSIDARAVNAITPLHKENLFLQIFHDSNETLTLTQIESLSSPLVLQAFLTQHIDYIRVNCLELFCQVENASLDVLLTQIFHAWDMYVAPQKLLPIINEHETYLHELQLVFATIIRLCFNMENFVSYIGQKELNIPLQTRISEIGLDVETTHILGIQIPEIIKNYMRSTWSQKYDSSTISKINLWVNEVLCQTIQKIVPESVEFLSEFAVEEIKTTAQIELARLRIDELYDIISNDNEQGLTDLCDTLITPEIRREIVDKFIINCEKKVFNGADTNESIIMYLKIIKAFSKLDPRGILLSRVNDFLKTVLQDRSDTPLKISEGIFGIEESPLNFLANALYARKSSKSREFIAESFRTWVPDPIDAPADFIRKQNQDTLSTLIGLYDNKEVFVKHLANLFKEELLEKCDKSIDNLLELYKALVERFGDSNLYKIRIMIDDIKYSKQIRNQKTDKVEFFAEFNPLILSKLYWPSLPEDQLYPQRTSTAAFMKNLEAYEQFFKKSVNKDNIALKWLAQCGLAKVELELEDRKIELNTFPENAVVIHQFHEHSKLSFKRIQAKTGLPDKLLSTCLGFWVDQKVLKRVKEDVYEVMETLETQDDENAELDQLTDSNSVVADPFEDMRPYWSYIVGMLTNLGSLPAEKIQSFLVMFVPSEDPYVKTQQELQNYLLAMVDEGKLKFEDEKYALTN